MVRRDLESEDIVVASLVVGTVVQLAAARRDSVVL